jgi:hypothetical protein
MIERQLSEVMVAEQTPVTSPLSNDGAGEVPALLGAPAKG